MSSGTATRAADRLGRLASLVKEAFERFDANGDNRLAAAMSYFLLLAVAPLLLMLNAVLGVASARLGVGEVPGVGEATATAATGMAQAVSWAGSYAPLVAMVLVVVGGVSVFGQFVAALEVIWATPVRRTPIREFLRLHALSLALLALTAFVLLAAVTLSAVASAFAGRALELAREAGLQLSGIGITLSLRIAPVLIASVALFWVAFTVAPDRPIRWRDSLSGALVTSGLFLLGQIGLSVYLSTTQRFNVFGTFQFFVVLIVWIYYSALVALWGAELTRLLVLAAEQRRERAGFHPSDNRIERLSQICGRSSGWFACSRSTTPAVTASARALASGGASGEFSPKVSSGGVTTPPDTSRARVHHAVGSSEGGSTPSSAASEQAQALGTAEKVS